MYPVGRADILGLIVLVWLLGLSYFVWRERKFLRQLFPKSDARDIRNKLFEVVSAIEEFDKKGQVLESQIRGIKKEGLYHIQKIAVLRYNPYNDTGGDQSFSLVMLNGNLTGVMLTSLHSRAGTRIYTKEIKVGKCDLELSKEEAQVLKQVVNSDD